LVEPRRLRRAKAAYTTRFVARSIARDSEGYGVLSGSDVVPRPGDVVMARVEHIGQHKGIELPDGRRATLFEGDDIIVAYGNRYAPDQFEAEVPGDLGPTNLVAAGGVAASVLSKHASVAVATTLRPVGLLTDARGVVTLARSAPYRFGPPQAVLEQEERPFTIGVVGTSMNSGKTTTVASIVRGLTAAGLDVAAGKVTGTGAGGDPGLYRDSGAARVLDFTDFGLASTYLLGLAEVRALLEALHRELSSDRPDAIVLEIADGLLQAETARLVCDPAFGRHVDSVVFTSREAMGALAGTAMLRQHGLNVAAVGGVLTSSPLATREASGALDVPVLDLTGLSDPSVALSLLPSPGRPLRSTRADAPVAV
jgi:hypothetical protein